MISYLSTSTRRSKKSSKKTENENPPPTSSSSHHIPPHHPYSPDTPTSQTHTRELLGEVRERLAVLIHTPYPQSSSSSSSSKVQIKPQSHHFMRQREEEEVQPSPPPTPPPSVLPLPISFSSSQYDEIRNYQLDFHMCRRIREVRYKPTRNHEDDQDEEEEEDKLHSLIHNSHSTYGHLASLISNGSDYVVGRAVGEVVSQEMEGILDEVVKAVLNHS